MYRIMPDTAYDGCIPITVYWVQKRKQTFFGYKWENIKGFDRRSRAEELLNLLRGTK